MYKTQYNFRTLGRLWEIYLIGVLRKKQKKKYMIKVKIHCLFNESLLHKLSGKFTLLMSMIEKELTSVCFQNLDKCIDVYL